MAAGQWATQRTIKEEKVPFWRLYYHIVWTTKRREPMINDELAGKLYPYLIRKARELDAYILQANGRPDHVHVIVAVPPKLSIAQLVKHLKGSSSHYINTMALSPDHFQWQRGYGALSIGARQLPAAEAYVIHQQAHHQAGTTNQWLEQVSEEDDGPATPGEAIRDSPATYDTDDWGL